MANTFIAYLNRVDEGTLAGGAWAAGLPLANLQSRVLSKPARSISTDAADTQFSLALTRERPIRVVALCRHNLSIAARVRFSAYEDAGLTDERYTSGWMDVWPAVYTPMNLEWRDPNFWSGRPTAEELSGYPWNFIHILPQLVYQRYWTIEIDDEDNPAGFVEIARLFIANGWQPVQNMDLGAAIGYTSRTSVAEAQDGTEYFDTRTPYRTAAFQIGYMRTDEAMGDAFDMQRRVDIHREVLYVYDPDDTTHLVRRSFLGRMRELSPIEQPYVTAHAAAFSIKELL